MALYIGSRLCDRHMKPYLQTFVRAIREVDTCTLATSVSCAKTNLLTFASLIIFLIYG